MILGFLMATFNPVKVKTLTMLLTIIILAILPPSMVNCEKVIPSSRSLPVSIPSSTSSQPIFTDKSFVIPVRLKLSNKDKNTTSSLIPLESKSSFMRWAPFKRFFGRQSRQTTTQLTATIALAILAALSAIVLALLIALLISIGSLGFAIKKCSFGFGKYLLKLFGSIDHHSHKFVSIINMITRILVEVLGRQNHQQDFLFNMIHIIREIGIARQKPPHHSIHDIDIPEGFKGFEKKNLDTPQPKNSFEYPHEFEPNKGFEGFPRNFDGFPRGFDETRSYPAPRGFDHPFNFVNKTVDFDFPGHYTRYSSQPNLQYQSPYSNRMDSPRQFSISSLFDRNRHPNHNYDSF